MDSQDTKFMMFFHSTFRNVGVFTTLSLATLAYARAYRKHNTIYDIILVLVSIGFLSLSGFMNYHLITEIEDYAANHKETKISVWKNVSEAMVYIHTTLFALGALTLYRVST